MARKLLAGSELKAKPLVDGPTLSAGRTQTLVPKFQVLKRLKVDEPKLFAIREATESRMVSCSDATSFG